jgi:hypothetical protein
MITLNSARISLLKRILVACGLALLAGARFAEATQPVHYHGGPVLESFTIHPLFWGVWSEAEIDKQMKYLDRLASYMSGKDAPKDRVPVIQQYGVFDVTVDKYRTSETTTGCIQLTPHHTCAMQREQIAGVRGGPLLGSSIIAQAQKNNGLAAFGPKRLIVVFLPHNYVLTNCAPFPSCGGAYHSSQSASEFWSVVPEDVSGFQAVTAHELLEASANPADDNSQGWDELADPCGGKPLITLKNIDNIQIPQVADDTQDGACNTTGYIGEPKRFNQLTFKIVTGGDDLRGDSSATASVTLPGGSQTFTLKSQSDSSWGNDSANVKVFAIPGPALPAALFGPVTITLSTHNSWPESDDFWDIASVDVTLGNKGSAESKCLLNESGGPFARIGGAIPSVKLTPRGGC